MAQPKTISVSIPHHLGQQEAKRRIAAGIDHAAAQFAAKVGQIDRTWDGDRLNLRLSVMGQSITGRLEVLADSVKIDVDVPWLLASFADMVKSRIESEGRRLLEQRK